MGLLKILKKIQINNVNRVVIGHVNINSIRNKFDMLSSMVKDNIDIIIVLEIKLDFSFLQAQFRIEGYAPPFRYDRNSHGGGIILFIRGDIPRKLISITPLKDFEGIFVELNFRKKKILLYCSYNPHKNLISNHLNILGTSEHSCNISFADFHSKFLYLLGKHAPVKKRYIRANQKNFIDKELDQAIIVRSKLRNTFLKLKTEENRLAYAKHRNYCVSYSGKQNLHFSLKK